MRLEVALFHSWNSWSDAGWGRLYHNSLLSSDYTDRIHFSLYKSQNLGSECFVCVPGRGAGLGAGWRGASRPSFHDVRARDRHDELEGR